MSVECVFKSDDESVRDWYGESNRRHQAWRDDVARFRGGFPDYEVHQMRGLRGGQRVVGLSGPESPGEGWRFHKKHTLWVPDKRTKIGKDFAAQIEALRYELEPMPGMPDTVVYESKWFHHGVDVFDGTIWVSWGCPAHAVYQSEWSLESVDEDMWEEGLLSEFYLAKEAA